MNSDKLSREGVFDAQLSFPLTFGDAPRELSHLVKRDGRRVAFEKNKIALGIFRAAESIGGDDRHLAGNIATAVTLYLSKLTDAYTPNVDEVHDTVARVLRAMGHNRTAQAYVLYRDRRAHARSLREGRNGATDFVDNIVDDDSVLCGELDEAITSLLKNVSIDDAEAKAISAAVKTDLDAVGIAKFTTGLVREILLARLREHGLSDDALAASRVGIPMSEAERIICMPPSRTDVGTLDPDETDTLLARRLKQEYALTRVFSADIARAHVRGDITIVELGQVDKFEDLQLPLERLKRFGIVSGAGQQVASPARDAISLASQIAECTELLGRHLRSSITWDAFNVYVAPFVKDLDETALVDIAASMLEELAPARSGKSSIRLGLNWDVPGLLESVESIGPRGAFMGNGYGAYVHTAQRFAWALLEVLIDRAGSPKAAHAPPLIVTLTPDFFRSPGNDSFLQLCAKCVVEGIEIRFNYREDALTLPFTEDFFRPSRILAQRVAINLPRAAYRNHTEGALLEEACRMLDVACWAHLEKRNFLQRLLELGSEGPLAMLTQAWDGTPFVELDRAIFLVSVSGLNECVQSFCGAELHETDAAMALAERILNDLRIRCRQWSRDEGVHIALSSTVDSSVSTRFAELDLIHYTQAARKVVKTGGEAYDIQYTSGVSLNPPRDMSPIDHLKREGRFHPFLDNEATAHLPKLDPETSPSIVTDMITKAFRHTPTRSIQF